MTKEEIIEFIRENKDEIRELLGVNDKDALIAKLIEELAKRPIQPIAPYPQPQPYYPAPAEPWPPAYPPYPRHPYSPEYYRFDLVQPAKITCGFETGGGG